MSVSSPGPWVIEPKQARGNWIQDANGNFVALACIVEGNPAEEDANARLLSAALDLYDAIRNSDDAHWTPAMRAAMAKADGLS